MASVGIFSALLVGLAGMGGGLVAFPPGERDAAYLNCAPEQTLIYTEWATRGEGKEGGEGVDGLVADPEITTMIADLKSAVMSLIEKNAKGAPPGLAEHLPPLLLDLVGRSGCLYVDYSPPENVEERLQNEQWLDLAGGLNVTLIINGGDKADETEQHLLALMSVDMQVTIRGRRWRLKTARFDREGNYFILALGEGSLERALAGLKGEVKGLGELEAFAKNYDAIKMDRIGGITWLNLGRIRDEGLKLAGPFGAIATVMIEQLGVGELNNCVTVSGVIDGQIATRTHLETGGQTAGLLSLAAGRGLTAKDFNQIPADCDFLASFTLDVPLVRDTVTTLIEQVQPGLMENYQAIESQVENDLGFSIEDEFLQAYGQQMTVFDSPAAGGLFATSLTFAVEVTDAEKADKIFTKLMQMLDGFLPGDRSNEYSRRGVFLEEREFLGHKVYFVNTIGDDVPVAPAFCQTDKQLLISLHPQALKAHLRFLKEGGSSYADKFGKAAPKGTVISYGTFAADKLVELIYTVIPFGAQLGLSQSQREGFDFDIFSIPSSKAILPYMKEARSWVVRTETGLMFESRSSIPVPLMTSVPMNLLFMIEEAIRP
ncbi:MAG: hypothetical protein P8M30_07070 [Planctomycetaceae bacterium]|nr:hypothetical protein [Planctomycetaceae bacterium]